MTSTDILAEMAPIIERELAAAPPVLDGKVDAVEWSSAAAFTGLSGNPIGKRNCSDPKAIAS